MMNLDFKRAACFGFSYPKSKCWLQIAKLGQKAGWESVDMPEFEMAFAKNVSDADESLAQFLALDIDSETEWLCSFNAAAMSWQLQIPGSPYSAVSEIDREEFEKHELFKKVASRAAAISQAAAEVAQTQILPKIQAGELLMVDEAALEHVLGLLSRQDVLDAVAAAKIAKPQI